MSKLFTAVAGKPFDWANPTKYVKCTQLTKKPLCYINGQWVTGTSGKTIAVEDPCTNEYIGEVPNFGKEETNAAITSAAAAFESWNNVLPRDRALIVRRWSTLMLEHQVSLGHILSRESGKVLSEGIGETLYAQRFVEWYSGEAERIYGDIIPGPRTDVQTTILKQPVGVVGIVTPWNFPSSMITRAAAAAIAAGCTVVVKPSELTPFSALALAQVAEEAGIPPGVFNVVTGEAKAIGDALLESFTVRKLAFTGSTCVGKLLYRGSAETMKKIGMELGGNGPFIVFDDADIPRAVDALIGAKFRNAGQTCICVNRVFLQAAVYDKFKDLLVEKVRALKVGNSFDKEARVGSLINKAAVTRLEAVVEDALKNGGVADVGGKATTIDGKGYFFEPTVLSGVRNDTFRCCQEELFGPVIPVVKFDTEEEVVALANSTKAGLASYFFTNDYRRQHRVAAALQFGMVGVNDCVLSAPCAPFGGVKESGLGRDGSKYGIEPFVDIKYVLFSKV